MIKWVQETQFKINIQILKVQWIYDTLFIMYIFGQEKKEKKTKGNSIVVWTLVWHILKPT